MAEHSITYLNEQRERYWNDPEYRESIKQKNRNYYILNRNECRQKEKIREKERYWSKPEYREKKIQINRDYYSKHKLEQRQKQKERDTRLKEKLNELFGIKCQICDSSNHLHLHQETLEKHKHLKGIGTTRRYYIRNQTTIIRLCQRCHNTVHTLLKLTFDQRMSMLKLIEQHQSLSYNIA